MTRWDLEVRQPPNSAPTPAHTPGGTAEAASSDAHSAMRCFSGRGELDPAVPQRALFRWSSRFPVAAQQKSHVGVESCSRGGLRKDHITGATKPAFPNLQGSDELGHLCDFAAGTPCRTCRRMFPQVKCGTCWDARHRRSVTLRSRGRVGNVT